MQPPFRTPTGSSVPPDFPAGEKPTPLHRAELALIVVASVQLCFLPWALGGMRAWSQIPCAGLSAAMAALAFVPRSRGGRRATGAGPLHTPWPKLRRFPIFWLGLALLGYIAAQALNPAWEYAAAADGAWWLEPLEHIEWLPSSAKAPFAQSNPWRAGLLVMTAWLTACALWVGFTRRISIVGLFTAVVVNGAILAFVGVLQHAAGNGKVLWSITPPASNFVATFFYKNHAGAYFNLVLALAAALGWWHFSRAQRRLQRASAAPLFAFCGLLLALVVVLSFSRAATLLMAVFLAVCGAMAVRWLATRPGEPRRLLIVGALCAALVAGLAGYFLNAGRAAGRINDLFTRDRATSISARQQAARATWTMASDRLATGWGAGNFRYFFPKYQRAYPEILHPSWAPDRVFLWEHAHNDYLEYLAELGLVGGVFPLAGLACWLVAAFRIRLSRHPSAGLVALGLVLLLGHCWIDFNLQNPAILLTAVTAATLSVSWARMESARDRSGTVP